MLAAGWRCAVSCKTHSQKPSAISVPLRRPHCTLCPAASSAYSQTRGKGKNKPRRARSCTQAIERQSLPEETGLTRPWGLSGRNRDPVSTDPSILPALPHFSLRARQGLKKCPISHAHTAHAGNASSLTLCRQKPMLSLFHAGRCALPSAPGSELSGQAGLKTTSELLDINIKKPFSTKRVLLGAGSSRTNDARCEDHRYGPNSAPCSSRVARNI